MGRSISETRLMRTLAIDLGTRRIGLAMSDQGGRFATPLEVLEVNSPDQALDPILTLILKEAVERLSSFAAEQDLIDRKRSGEKITRKQKKDRLDALAAAGFLQAFLDGKLPP